MIQAGSRVGEAVVEARIGEGATSTVWRATWRGRKVVLKVPHAANAASDEFVSRMQREAAALHAIKCANVVEILDVGRTEEGLPYVVLEYVDGPTLRAIVEKGPSVLTPAGASRILDGLARALEEAHRAGVVHRDVKPENVMLEGRAHDLREATVKLVDFGLAKPQEDVAKLTTTGTPLGTPAYMAPEQWWNEGVGPAADQYAFGLVAYELLTGAPPFPATSLPELMEAHLHQTPPPIANAPPAVATAIARMLAKKPADRYPSMSDARLALREALGGEAPRRRPLVLPYALVVALPAVLFAYGYPGARDPRESIPLAGWAVFGVFLAYLAGVLLLRRTWLVALAPAILGTFATYTGWLTVLATVEKLVPAERVPVLHQGLYEANVNRFFGLGLSAALYFALAASVDGKTVVDMGRRAAALCLGLAFTGGAFAIWIRSANDLVWTRDVPRAERVAALLAVDHLKATSGPLVVASIATLMLFLGFRVIRKLRDPRELRALWRSIHRGALGALAIWLAVDLMMLVRLRQHVAAVVASQASELELMAELDPPSADGLPPAPVGPALKIARDRVLVDDAPVGLTSALEHGGLDDVLRADLSHRLAREEGAKPTLVVLADRNVSTAAVVHALEVARSVGVVEVAFLFTRGPSPAAVDKTSEAAASLPSDFGALVTRLDELPVLEGERYEDAARTLTTKAPR